MDSSGALKPGYPWPFSDCKSPPTTTALFSFCRFARTLSKGISQPHRYLCLLSFFPLGPSRSALPWQIRPLGTRPSGVGILINQPRSAPNMIQLTGSVQGWATFLRLASNSVSKLGRIASEPRILSFCQMKDSVDMEGFLRLLSPDLALATSVQPFCSEARLIINFVSNHTDESSGPRAWN